MTSTTDENVSTSHGACVFCNTTRPIEQVLCPACGRGWIDASATDSVESVAKAEAAPIRTITTPPALRVRRSTHRSAWWIPLAAALVVFAGYWVVVTALGHDTTQADSPLVAPATLAPTTTIQLEQPPPTLPPPTTTTSTVPPTTATPLPPMAAGEPIGLDELQLGAVELGEIAFGTRADDALPDLVATFGQPSAIDGAGGDWGLCDGVEGRIVSFGGLHVITQVTEGIEEFAGFVLEPSGTASDRLLTFSGLGLDATLAELEATYRAVDLDAGDETTTWIVRSTNDGRTLLWGTADGTGAGATIDTIASPNACDGGPTFG